MIEDDARDILAPWLLPNETLLWAQLVNKSAYNRASRGRQLYVLVLILFSLAPLLHIGFLLSLNLLGGVWGGVFMSLNPISIAVMVVCLVGVLISLNQMLIISRGARSAYGLTNRRCMIATPGRKALRAWAPLSHVVAVQSLGQNDEGTVVLTAAPNDGRAARAALALTGIKHPQNVEALLLSVMEAQETKTDTQA